MASYGESRAELERDDDSSRWNGPGFSVRLLDRDRQSSGMEGRDPMVGFFIVSGRHILWLWRHEFSSELAFVRLRLATPAGALSVHACNGLALPMLLRFG